MDLSSIIDNLSEADMEKLRQTAAAFFGAGETPAPEKKNETGLSLPGLTPEFLGQAAKISAALSRADPRSDFILALKPLLTGPRQKKADEAAMMVRLFGLVGMLRGGET